MNAGADVAAFPFNSNKPDTARLLLVSAHDCDQQVLESILDPNRWTVLRAFDRSVARLSMAAADPDVIVIDARLPDGTWVELFDWIQLAGNAPPVVVLSESADLHEWAEVLNRGAFDLLSKPLLPGETARVLDMALRSGRGPAHWRASTA